MSSRDNWKKAVREAIDVPDCVAACASACVYDLMNGPSFARIPYGNVANFTDDNLATYYADLIDDCVPEAGDVIEETYCGRVGDTVRAFIDELPYEAWVDMDCDCYMDKEPEQYEKNPDYDPDDDDSKESEYFECDLSNVYHIRKGEIIEALFGRTLAREFS